MSSQNRLPYVVVSPEGAHYRYSGENSKSSGWIAGGGVVNQLPAEGIMVISDDIDGIVVPLDFKISVIRCQPLIQDIPDLDLPVSHEDPSRGLFPSITGTA